MADFIINNGILIQYKGKKTDVMIPEGVTDIRCRAFAECEHVRSITIPCSVTHIEQFAFTDCWYLQRLTIPESVINVERDAFMKKPGLSKCILAPACQDKEQCKMLLNALGTMNLALPFLLGTLETNEIILNNLKTRIINKKFRERFIPWLIDENHADALNKLLSITKKISVEELDFYIGISINAPEIRTLLLEYKNKRYPAEILEKMKELQMEKEFGLRKKTLADYKKIFSIKKENGIYIITKYHACEESVSVPGEINGIPVKIGKQAFYGCEPLTDVYLEDGITEIGNHAFAFCFKLQNVFIPESVTQIDTSAFQCCSQLSELRLPSNLIKLGDSVFHNCERLQNIVIPDGITKIGNFLFHSCENLKTITLPNGITSLGLRAFAYCENLERITLPETVTEIGSQAFSHCKKLTDITFPQNVTHIGDSAFLGCESLKSICIPDGITSIAQTVFCRCTDLQSVMLPSNLKRIESSAFFGCISLRSITVPDTVTNIESYAFFDCKNLTLLCSETSCARKYAEEESIPCKIV